MARDFGDRTLASDENHQRVSESPAMVICSLEYILPPENWMQVRYHQALAFIFMLQGLHAGGFFNGGTCNFSFGVKAKDWRKALLKGVKL